MNKLQVDNNWYIVYAPDSLKYITDNMYEILDNRIAFYKELFDVNSFRKIQINYFDKIEDFRKFIYDLRKEDNLPNYARGTFDKGMINAYVENNLKVSSPLYNKRLFLAPHELFHIMYQELIWQGNYNRIVWFDEGCAQYFSLENEEVLKEDNFKDFLNSLLEETKVIPNLNALEHGDSFVTDSYNGYKLSLLGVKYLYDALGEEEFKKLMRNPEEIIEYGNSVVEDAFKYYLEDTIKK